MSLAPGVSTALLNLCAQLQDGRERPANSPNPPAPALAEESEATQKTASTGAVVGAIATTSGPSTAAEKPVRPATDYEWLRSALASVEAPEKRVKQLLFRMENKTAEGSAGSLTREDQLEALEELSDMVEDVNWATEFSLMDGPQRLLQVLRLERSALPLLTTSGLEADMPLDATDTTSTGETRKTLDSPYNCHPSPAVPILTQLAMIIAHSAQLNEPVQMAYETAQWQTIVLPLMEDTVKAIQQLLYVGQGDQAIVAHRGGSEVGRVVQQATHLMRLFAALLHACSCLCRDCEPNTIVFLRSDGLSVLVNALTLTRNISESIGRAETTGQSSAMAVTTIACGEAANEESEDIFAAFLSATNKVTTRAFFFTAYVASTGVASEGIIEITCLHAESQGSDEVVQRAAARVLTELVAKSPKVIKSTVHKHMPHRLKEWRTRLQRTEDGDAEEDERRRFVDALERVG